jgi:trimethylamine--corrinoid protein Co-methyltransferase
MSDTDSNNLGLPGFGQLTGQQTERLHEASLLILERTGMRFHDEEALALFQKGGARVDGTHVCIPPHLVEWAIRTAPCNITIYDREGRRAMEVGGYRTYFGVGSDCRSIYDLDTGEHREATLEDVVQGVRLVDALPHIDFVMSMFLPTEVPTGKHEPQQMVVMLEQSTKPIIFVGEALASTVCAIEMAAAVAGGVDKLAQRPNIINYVNVISSFNHNSESVQRLLYAAECNLPTIYSPGNARGISAPLTSAGSIAARSAGCLAGLVLSQLKREGSPYIRSNPDAPSLDLRTMVSLYALPDGGPMGWDLAHYQRIPSFGYGGCSDSKVFDAQAAADALLTLITHTLGGCNLIHDIGYLDAAMTGSLELVAYCDEIIGWLKRYLRPAEINEETLALDVIDEIGPDGEFLACEHTLTHLREDWQPTLFDRFDYPRWADRGATTLQQRATKKVKQILEEHEPATLPETAVAALNDILKKYV